MAVRGLASGRGIASGRWFGTEEIFVDLESWYKMNASSGNEADSSGNGNTLTQVGTVASDLGKIGNARGSYSEDMNYFSRAPLILSGSLSFSCWFKGPSFGGVPQVLMSQGSTGDSQGYQVLLYEDGHETVRAIVDGGYQLLSATGSAPMNQWNHAVMVFDAVGVTLELWVNGATTGPVPWVPANFSTVDRFTVGWEYDFLGSGFQAFTGLVDLVGVWSKALLAAEVAFLFDTRSGRDHPFGATSIGIASGRQMV